MNPLQVLFSLLFPTATVNNTTASIAAIDTQANNVNWTRATFFINVGAIDIAMTALKVQECDTLAGSYTDCTDTVFGSGSNPALPTASSDNKQFQITVTGRKRYLKIVPTVGNGSTGAVLTVSCILSSPKAVALENVIVSARGLTGQEVIA
jgi:hypothetical protein